MVTIPHQAKSAWMCPGQGSQSIGMLSFCAEDLIIQRTFEEVSEVVGHNLWQLVQDGPKELLDKTEWTQPIMLAAGVACGRWLLAHHHSPDFLLGHSLGEWSALVLSQALSLTDTTKAVVKRAYWMEEAVKNQDVMMMAVIGIKSSELTALCQEVSLEKQSVVELANYNSMEQLIVGGHRDSVMMLKEKLALIGVKRTIPISVSVPSHTSLMRPAQQQLQKEWQFLNFSTPTIPIIHNVHAKPADSKDELLDMMLQQLSKPVKWSASLQYLAEHQVSYVVEVGPGQILTKLAKKNHPDFLCESFQTCFAKAIK